jgi:hypothetical protein
VPSAFADLYGAVDIASESLARFERIDTLRRANVFLRSIA